jgi:hypothetical protein
MHITIPFILKLGTYNKVSIGRVSS